jgi:hypothetical protein
MIAANPTFHSKLRNLLQKAVVVGFWPGATGVMRTPNLLECQLRASMFYMNLIPDIVVVVLQSCRSYDTDELSRSLGHP